jgi:hypothetical protein
MADVVEDGTAGADGLIVVLEGRESFSNLLVPCA